jgi:N6-L-threonylcarbamoyladenine synthase
MLIKSDTLTDHGILAETSDIAIGDCLDKAARAILPSSQLKFPFGKALEDFAFGENGYNPIIHKYEPPRKRQDEIERRSTRWGWSIGPPLSDSKGGEKSSRRMIYSFAGVLSTVDRLMTGAAGAARGVEERRELAKETMRVTFEHLTSRILLYLQDIDPEDRKDITTVVVSGGVAANGFLRHILRSTLDVRGFDHISLAFPPVELCTDNALMVAWAGLEMYDAGYESKLEINALRKWSLDPTAEDGGILGVGGWVKTSIKFESDELEDEQLAGRLELEGFTHYT